MVFSTQEYFLFTQELIQFTEEILPLLPKKLRTPYSRNLSVTNNDVACRMQKMDFRVLKVASLQRLKMEALIPAPAKCEVRSVRKYLKNKRRGILNAGVLLL